MSQLHHVQSFSRDYDNRSVDATIRTNGGTYHTVEVIITWDDGSSERGVRKCFSRSKAVDFAMYATRKDR